MEMKIDKYTNLTKLTVRYIKERKLYKQLIKNLILYNIPLTNLNDCKTIIKLTNFIEKYTNSDVIGKHNILLNDIENYIYEKTFNKTKIQLFHQFLDDNKIRKQYYDNLKKRNKPYSENMNGYYSLLHMLINDAFDWTSSNEGFNYWCNMHKKLQEYENNILKIIN